MVWTSFEGENHIEIQDKFIMSSKGIECLKKYYFPHIPKGSVVDIYCEIIEGVTKQDICNQLEDSFLMIGTYMYIVVDICMIDTYSLMEYRFL